MYTNKLTMLTAFLLAGGLTALALPARAVDTFGSNEKYRPRLFARFAGDFVNVPDGMTQDADGNEALFATRDGCRQLVTDLVNILYETLYADGQPLWANLFLLRSMITAQDARRNKAFNAVIFEPLGGVFRRITGNEDRMTALCWVLNILSPGSYLTACATDFATFEPTDKIDYAFCRRLQAMVTRNALFAVGLQEDR